MFAGFLKNLIQDIGEQPGEEIRKTKCGRVLSAGVSVPVELGCVTLWCGCIGQPGNPPEPILLGFSGGFSDRHGQVLTQSPALLLFFEDGCGGKLLIMGGSPW